MLLQQQYLVLPVNLHKGIFLTVSQHFVLQKKERKKKKIATPLAIARNIGAIFEDPNLRYKINVVQFGGKR